MYKSKIYFHLPLQFDNWRMYDTLFYLMEYYKECFENFEIGSLYGSPDCVWNGGRSIVYKETKENLEKDKNFIEGKNISLRFTFTNPLIDKSHLNDEYSNMILEMFANRKHQIICNSPILENYIYNKYSNLYRYVSSTSKCLSDKKDICKELNNNIYDLVVLNVNDTDNINLIKKIDFKNREKLELICNSYCYERCPLCKAHYKFIGEQQLKKSSERSSIFPDENIKGECKSYKNFFDVKNSKVFISKEKINKYIKLGINNFKLDGRTASIIDNIEGLIYYLVKDEFQLKIRDLFLKLFFDIIY